MKSIFHPRLVALGIMFLGAICLFAPGTAFAATNHQSVNFAPFQLSPCPVPMYRSTDHQLVKECLLPSASGNSTVQSPTTGRVVPQWWHTGYGFVDIQWSSFCYAPFTTRDYYNTTGTTESFTFSSSYTASASLSISVGSDFPGAYKAQLGITFSYSRTVTDTANVSVPAHHHYQVKFSELGDSSDWILYNFLSSDQSFHVMEPNGNYCFGIQDWGSA
jgi:hypothetical protein